MLRKTIDGKRVAFYGSSDREVEDKLAEYISGQAERQKEKLKLSVYADRWWEDKEPKLSPNSTGNFKTAYNRIKDEFGDEVITDITAQEIYAFLERYAKKNYSARVVGNLKTVLKQTYDLAFIDGLVDRNPVKDIPPVKTKKPGHRDPASEEDIKIIEAHKLDDVWCRLHYIMIYTGLRRGEIIGIQEKDIDRVNRIIYIRRNIAYGQQKPTIKEPKSEAGVRTVPILDTVIDVLPKGSSPEEYVFFPKGLPTMRVLEYGLSHCQKKLGLKCTAHNLRHNFGDLLLEADLKPKDMQDLLGHSSIDVTMDVYTQISKRRKTKTTKQLNDYVNSLVSTDGVKSEKT